MNIYFFIGLCTHYKFTRMKVQQILDRKLRNEILAISPDASVYKALEELERYNIGALLVMEGPKLVGIFLMILKLLLVLDLVNLSIGLRCS